MAKSQGPATPSEDLEAVAEAAANCTFVPFAGDFIDSSSGVKGQRNAAWRSRATYREHGDFSLTDVSNREANSCWTTSNIRCRRAS
jgi:hypothetical protein